MPFTPFHFGPGIAFLALIPRRMSLWAFCAVNVVMDLEPGILLLLDRFPLHRFMHTIPGSATAVAVTTLLFSAWSAIPGAKRPQSVLLPPSIPLPKVLSGAILGAGTHLLLDGIMHDDMTPWSPWTSENPLLGAIDVATMHGICALSGAVGGIALLWRRQVRRPKAP